MSQRWYYKVLGHEFGPVPLEELKELIELEAISSTDAVRTEDEHKWTVVSSVSALGFATQASRTLAPIVPSKSNEWYCLFLGHEFGPVTFEEIIHFAESCQLEASDQVKFGVEGKWRPVGSIGRLSVAIPPKAGQQLIPRKKRPETIVAPTIAPQVPSRPPAPVTAEVISAAVPVEAVKTAPVTAPVPVPSKQPSAPSVPVVSETTSTPLTVTESISNTKTSTVARINSNSSPMSSMPNRATVPSRPIARSSNNSSRSSIADLIKGQGIVIGVAAAVLVLLVVGWMCLPEGTAGDIERHRSLSQLLGDVRAARSSNASDFNPFKKRAQELGARYIPLLKSADGSNPAKQNLLWAVRDELPKMMKKDLSQETVEEKRFATRLANAATRLGIK
ncbi:MAG: hypothetical protein JWP89_1148 [Schlesneria sp.]|nr:hypothetical protein [Schlesneria sp.]